MGVYKLKEVSSKWSKVSDPALLSIAATLAFIAITIWWLTQDRRIPDWDPGRHTTFAFRFHDALRSGDLLGPIDAWTRYPPLVHIVGALGIFVGGREVWPVVMTQNLVFLPLLVLGCYQTGRLVFGDARAGLLAVVFALGTPMIVGQFHVFMLDAPETALVAVSVWLLLASRAFEDVGLAGLAGAAVGLGCLTKESFVVFVAGVVLVLIGRGGWRHWRGLLVFGGVAVCVAGPWYLLHFAEVRSLAQLAGSASAAGEMYSAVLTPPRFSQRNVQWFFWTGLNYQYLAPLLAFAAIGTGVAIVGLLRRRPAQSLTLELLAGGVVSWLGFTWQLPHDARYSLPALVYVAVLATGWIVSLRGSPRVMAQALLATFAIANVLGASFGLGHRIMVALPGAPGDSYVMERRVTLATNDGFVFGEPRHGGDLLPVMRMLRDRGIRLVQWIPANATTAVFNWDGLRASAAIAELPVNFTAPYSESRTSVFVVHRSIRGSQQPCVRLYDGSGVWVRYGSPLNRSPADACPYRRMVR